jgi:tetratricopeptide (TPR) repeat protein
MAVEGRISEFSLPDFLQILSMNRKSGIITLKKDLREAEIFLKNGTLQFISFSRDDKLYRKLLETGFYGEQEEGSELNEKKLLLFLSKNRKITKEITAIIREIVEERMAELISWVDGYFRFEEKASEELLPDIFSFNTQDILLEGSRRFDEWGIIHKKIPDFNAILTLSEKWLKEGAALDLSSDEWKVLSLIDGRSTVREIIDKFKKPSIEIAKIIVNLLDRGLIEFEEKKKMELEKAKKEAEILFVKAKDLCKKKKFIEAEALLTKALMLHPDFVMAHLLLADLYYILKNYRLASQEYYQVIKRDPENPLGYYGMGFVRIKFGDLLGALKALEKAYEYSKGELKEKINRLISLLRTILIEIDNRKLLI